MNWQKSLYMQKAVESVFSEPGWRDNLDLVEVSLGLYAVAVYLVDNPRRSFGTVGLSKSLMAAVRNMPSEMMHVSRDKFVYILRELIYRHEMKVEVANSKRRKPKWEKFPYTFIKH